MHGRDCREQNTSSHSVFAVMAFQEIRRKFPAFWQRAELSQGSSPVLCCATISTELIREGTQVKSCRLSQNHRIVGVGRDLCGHSSQQPSYPTTCLSIPTVETAVSEVLEQQKTPSSSSNRHPGDTSAFLTDVSAGQTSSAYLLPATRSTEPVTLRLECSPGGTGDLGVTSVC